jgi:hypothetical protein
MFALLPLLTLAFAAEPVNTEVPKADLISNFLFINQEAEIPTVTLIGGRDPLTGIWCRLYTINGTRDGISWHFLVPHDRFIAFYDEVVVTPTAYYTYAVASIPDAKVTVTVEPAKLEMELSRNILRTGFVGGSYYVNLDHGISCEGSACDSLRVK